MQKARPFYLKEFNFYRNKTGQAFSTDGGIKGIPGCEVADDAALVRLNVGHGHHGRPEQGPTLEVGCPARAFAGRSRRHCADSPRAAGR